MPEEKRADVEAFRDRVNESVRFTNTVLTLGRAAELRPAQVALSAAMLLRSLCEQMGYEPDMFLDMAKKYGQTSGEPVVVVADPEASGG